MNFWNEVRKELGTLDGRYRDYAPFSVVLFSDGSGHVCDFLGKTVAIFGSFDNHFTDKNRLAEIRGVCLD